MSERSPGTNSLLHHQQAFMTKALCHKEKWKNTNRLFIYFISLVLLLLSCGTEEAKPHIAKRRFYTKVDVSWEASLYNGRNPTSSSVDRWQHQPSSPTQFLICVWSRGKFSPEKTSMEKSGSNRLLDFSNCRLNEHLHHMHSVGLWWHLEWNPGLETDSITTRLPTAISLIYWSYIHLYYNTIFCIFLVFLS